MKSKLIIILILISYSHANSQNKGSIMGKKNLIGIQTELGGIFNNKSNINTKFTFEHLFGRKTNIGLNFSFSKFKTEYYRWYYFRGETVNYQYEGKEYFVIDPTPKPPVTRFHVYSKVFGFNINIKRYFIQRRFRNTGTYINYKLGFNRGSCIIPKNSSFDIGKTVYNYYKTVSTNEDIQQTYINKYLGIELGNSFTIFNPRLYFNLSIGIGYNFGHHNYVDYSLKERIRIGSSEELSLSQLANLNLGISYAL